MWDKLWDEFLKKKCGVNLYISRIKTNKNSNLLTAGFFPIEIGVSGVSCLQEGAGTGDGLW